MKRVLFALSALTMILCVTALRSQDLQEIMSQVADPTRKAEFKSEYTFDAFVQMELTTTRKDGKPGKKVLLDSYLNKGGGSYAMAFTQEGTPVSIILDKDNGSLLMLTESEGSKMGMVMAVNADAIGALSEGSGQKAGTDSFEPLKTGNSKSIQGYPCEEYLIEEGSGEIRVWASEKLGEELGKEALSNQQTFGGAFTHAVFVNGMVMEFQSIDKKSGEKSSLTITRLELNGSHTISTSGYNVMSMGQFQ
ncbi:MAG: DUF4412 domain-containing protein [Bacteroidota bacterium]